MKSCIQIFYPYRIYGFRSQVSDVKNAVVLLGFNAVRNAIISVSVINACPKHFCSRILK